MFDFLVAWMYSYNLMFVVGLVLGAIIGFGAKDLWLSWHLEHETTGVAYDAGGYDILDEVEMIVDAMET
jgi:hypothetical protein